MPTERRSGTPGSGPSAATTVRLRDVTVRFPRSADPALRVDDLRLGRGEQVLLVGPSGAGKSTMLHALTGVVPLSVHSALGGVVEVCGQSTVRTTVAALSRHVATVAQDPAAGVCLPRVEQELALVLENRAVPPDDIDPRIDAALARVGAGHLRHRPSRALSGGETQRVALAAALVADPDVLLVDEPTSMLDGAGVSAVRAALSGAAGPSGPTVVVVEHRLDEVAGRDGLAALPGRVVVLDDQGAVLADGPTAETLCAHAERLARAGCWLPLEVELGALGGRAGGLAVEENRQLLRRLAAAKRPPGPRAAGSQPVLSARGLAVARVRDAPAVVRDVDLDLVPGEVTALLGPNGAGKSSLLLTLAGLLPPRAGRVVGARAGLVFQNAEHQFVEHTVADEVGHGLGPGQEGVVARLLRRHRLEHLADRSPYRLSGGEKRRLSLAAMLAHDRAALLLDEPTLGLDRRDTIDTIATLREEAAAGRAVLVASHDLRTVATLADRVVVLGAGRVIADGPTERVLGAADVLARARLDPPPLVRWLLRELGDGPRVRSVLRALDTAACPRELRASGGAA